jgi:hypothetical protein
MTQHNNDSFSNILDTASAPSNLEAFSEEWSDAVAQTADKLSAVTRQLERDWSRSQSTLPDPVKIIRRINALEGSMVQLQECCKSMAGRRHHVLAAAVKQANENEHLLQEVGPRFMCM